MASEVEVVLRPLDMIMARYGQQLRELGADKSRKIMARALNYEGRKSFTLVKRAIRDQSSVSYEAINKGTKFMGTSTGASAAMRTVIDADGEYLVLKYFKPRQIRMGVSATVWGKRQRYKGAFGAPGGRPELSTPFHRLSRKRYPIKPLFGANLAVEMVKDTPPAIHAGSVPRIADRIEKEIAAVLRGY
jgi:hypothetical protein